MEIMLKIKSVLFRLIKSPTVVNIITVGVITLVVKFLGFYKEMVIAEHFGLSEILDTFYIAALVPGFVYNVFLNAFSTVFIPNYIAEKKSTNKTAAFQTTSFLVTIITAIVFMGIAYLFTDVYLELFFKGHTPEYYTLVKLQFHYLLPCIAFWGLSSLLSGLLNIYDEFRFSSVYSGITSVTMLLCLLLYSDALGAAVLAVGMLVGSFFEFLFLLYIAFKNKILKFDIPEFFNSNTVVMFKQIPAKISSGLLIGLIPLTDQYFAAQLAVGSIAALNYGYKIPAFLIGIMLLALGNVLLPYFSKLIIEDVEDAYKKLKQILLWTFLGIMAMVLCASLLSTPIVRILFERGNFTSSNTSLVSSIQIVFLLGVPFAISENLMVKFLTSINKNVFPAYVSLGSMILNIIFDFIFVKLYGVIGIALCTTIIYIIKGGVLLHYTNKQKLLMIQS